jgi:mRNA interferase YafQ
LFTLKQSNQFKKDLKLAKKRGLKVDALEEIVTLLVTEKTLPPQFKTHKLKGKYEGLLECHIQPDWLLIWDQEDEIKLISLIRTGSHSDLF